MISIVICTYNRQDYLPKCLMHLKNQNCRSEDFEIILINNNSTDQTEQICQGFLKENPDLNVNYFVEINPGLSFARNRGIKEAKGSIICFIDDDGFAIPRKSIKRSLVIILKRARRIFIFTRPTHRINKLKLHVK